MAKPESRDSGAPIQWFTAGKPSKKDNGNYARQNEAAYMKALAQQMQWADQFRRDTGRLPPNYAMGTNLPPVAKTPYNQELHDVLAKEAEKAAKRDAKKLKINETTPDLTAHEKTDKLRAQLDAATTAKEAVKAAGQVSTPIEGVTPKEHMGWFERNIGHKIGTAYRRGVSDTVVGDVAGRGLDLIARPERVIAAMTIAAGENMPTLPLGMDQYNVFHQTKDPRTQSNWKKMSPDEQQVALDAYNKILGYRKKNVFSQMLDAAEGKNKEDASFTNYLNLRTEAQLGKNPAALRVLATTGGLGLDIVADPLNVVKVDTVAKGIKAAKGVRDSEEVIRGANAAAHTAADTGIARNVIEGAQPGWKAPLELPQRAESLRPPMPEIYDESRAIVDRFKAAKDAQEAARVRDATAEGLNDLKKQARKSALNLQSAKNAAKAGRAGADEVLAGRQAAHEAILKRIQEAEQFQATARITPVGGNLANLEKASSRLDRLKMQFPERADLAVKADKARKALEQARVASISENADRLLEVTKKLAAGKTITKKEVDAVVGADPSVQDRILAVAKSAEKMPGKMAGEPVSAAGIKASSVEGLPSSRIMKAIDEAANASIEAVPGDGALAEAKKTLIDASGPKSAQTRAQGLLDAAEARRQRLTSAGIKAKIAQDAVIQQKDPALIERALKQTGAKVRAQRKIDPLSVTSARKAEMLNESLLEEVLPTTGSMERIMNDATGKRFALTVGGKDLGEFKPIGKILSGAHAPFELVGKLGNTSAGRTFAKAFRIGAHFPGETNYIRQQAENSGIIAQAKWARRVRQELTSQMSREEARLISKAIESRTVLSDARLEALRQKAIEMTHEIFVNEANIGKYMPIQEHEGYVYHYYHSHNSEKIKEFKKFREADIKAGYTKGNTLGEAEQAGLKPERRIDQILLMQHRNYVTDLQRANFRQGVISEFGTLTDNAPFARGLGLEAVGKDKINKMFLDKAAATGGEYYLPPEIHKTFKAMDELMGIGHNPKADNFLRFYDALVRGYKTSTTIGNIGNWVNNTAGDVFLNYLDGVRDPRWYTRAIGVLKAGEEQTKELTLGGHTIRTSDILHEFERKAPTGGFIGTEGSRKLAEWGGRGGGIREKILHRAEGVVSGVQGAYEAREQSVRLAHFLHATDDELKRLGHLPLHGEGGALDIATERAAKRVSKWNIDYTALTPFERQIRKRFVPFYTFMRKATPLMLEGMITRPGKINQYAHGLTAIERMLNVPHEADDGTNWPVWAQQQGITRLSGGSEPFYFRDPSPLNVINRTFAGESQMSPLTNLENMASPPIKMFLEAAQRQTLYNQRPITDWNSWLLNQIPQVSMGARLAGQPLSAQKPSGTNPNTAGTSLAERLSTFGIPIGKMSEVRQQAEIHRQLNSVDDIFKKIKNSIEPYGYKITNGGSAKGKNGKYFIVKDSDGNIIGRYRDITQAWLDLQDKIPAQP